MRVIFENPRMLLFTPYHVVTSCKISEKYNGWLLRKVDADARTHGHRVNSKVPIPTKVGGPTTATIQTYIQTKFNMGKNLRRHKKIFVSLQQH